MESCGTARRRNRDQEEGRCEAERNMGLRRRRRKVEGRQRISWNNETESRNVIRNGRKGNSTEIER